MSTSVLSALCIDDSNGSLSGAFDPSPALAYALRFTFKFQVSTLHIRKMSKPNTHITITAEDC